MKRINETAFLHWLFVGRRERTFLDWYAENTRSARIGQWMLDWDLLSWKKVWSLLKRIRYRFWAALAWARFLDRFTKRRYTCAFQTRWFGAQYEDGICRGGRMWDLDSDNNTGDGLLYSGGEDRCPICKGAGKIGPHLYFLAHGRKQR